MDEIKSIITCLQQTPKILKSLTEGIPSERLKIKRIQSKWNIHEHVCHLTQAEKMIYKRFEEFNNVDYPNFKPYLPSETIDTHDLSSLDFDRELMQFTNQRERLITLVLSFDNSIWAKSAKHPEYIDYSAIILLRHTLMHDHFHMYRIEELWLTKDEYLSKRK